MNKPGPWADPQPIEPRAVTQRRFDFEPDFSTMTPGELDHLWQAAIRRETRAAGGDRLLGHVRAVRSNQRLWRALKEVAR